MGLDGLIFLAPNFPTLFYCNIERIENNDDTPKKYFNWSHQTFKRRKRFIFKLVVIQYQKRCYLILTSDVKNGFKTSDQRTSDYIFLSIDRVI